MEIVDDEFQELVDPKIAETHFHLPGLDPRDIDEVVQERVETASMRSGFLDEDPVHRRIVDGTVEERFEVSLEGEDGRAKLMGDVPQDFTSRPLQFF